MKTSTLQYYLAQSKRKLPKPFLRWLVPIAILPLLFGFLRNKREQPVAIPQPVAERTAASADFVLVIDDSGSAFGPSGTDPQGQRYNGARQILKILEEQAIGFDDRLGVVHFGSVVTSTPLSPVIEDATKIRKSLQLPNTNLGGTEYSTALNEASRLFGTGQPDRKRVILFFTDGINNDSSAEIDTALSGLGSKDIHVFLYNVSAELRDQFVENAKYWKTRATTVNKLYNLRGNRAERAFARVLYRQLSIATNE